MNEVVKKIKHLRATMLQWADENRKFIKDGEYEISPVIVFENYPDYQKEWVKGRMMFKHYSNISL